MINTRLAGRTVLVTGGSGNIGAAISRAFAAQGACVAIHYLEQDPPAPTGAEWAHITPAADEGNRLAEELGNGSFAVSADLSDPDGPSRLVRAVTDRTGAINVLVNNAAHCETPDTVETLTYASMDRHYRVNAIAPLSSPPRWRGYAGTTTRCASSTSPPTRLAPSPARPATEPPRRRWRRSPGPPLWTWQRGAYA